MWPSNVKKQKQTTNTYLPNTHAHALAHTRTSSYTRTSSFTRTHKKNYKKI